MVKQSTKQMDFDKIEYLKSEIIRLEVACDKLGPRGLKELDGAKKALRALKKKYKLFNNKSI